MKALRRSTCLRRPSPLSPWWSWPLSSWPVCSASALTKKDVKDASTLDALNKELSVELPVYEGCVADDTAGFKSATAKLNEQADWYKAYTQSLQKAVDAVNASKK